MDSLAVNLVDLVVHELRTPVTVALGSLRQLGPLADPVQQAALARAMRSCERVEQLATEMREWSRVQTSAPEVGAVAVSRAMTEAVRAATATRPDVAVMTGDVPAELMVQGLPSLFTGALTSLLIAVVRAARAGEAVTVAVTATDTTATLDARRSAAAPDDTGRGFDAGWPGGLGFSLPLAHAVVARGGGTVIASVSADGRLQSVSVQLAVAPPVPPR